MAVCNVITMLALLQRVRRANVVIADCIIAEIAMGLAELATQ